MATRHRTDFNMVHESSMKSNSFRLHDDRFCILPRAHSTPKFAIWCSTTCAFVVSTMSPGMRRCCDRRPRIIHRRGRWWPATPGWPRIGPIWDPGRAKFASEELAKWGVDAQLSAMPPATSHPPQQPTTSSWAPATIYQRQAISHQPPAADDEQPATSHQRQSPATSTNYQPPAREIGSSGGSL